ncbi:phage major capsid protein [Mesorhizobium sp. BR1-1-9]|uniref:phage major capsid protein n=1 Tax=Mesorhizobium sp. BR1-1-9 TaxID=2876646 RepID=UPI001CD095E5|nr:phage major capsid protein [Mesorhizobium sp. BR1-1-9]MBZ9873483.1 phage major capsid protein [Mesorhizobium sp. BR1-1-9]
MALITELRAKQATLVAEARERLDQIGAATDTARAAELEVQHDAAMAEYDKLEARIEREEKLAGLEKRAEELRGKQRPISRDSEARGQDDGQTIEYRHVFAKMVCGVAPDELSAEERAVLATGRAEFRTQTAGTTTAGGFTVPTELKSEIIRSVLAWGPMYDPGVATEMVTSSGNPIKIPTVNDTTVPAVDHTEGTALTDDGGSDATFGQKSLDAYAFDTEFIRWSWELDMDSVFNMEALLGSLLGERLGRIANLRLTTGSGASAPNGIVTASSLGVTAAAVAAITFDEIIDLEHSVDPAYRGSPKAAYMLNDTTLKAIRKIKNGSGDYVWQMGDVQKGVPGSLNGRKYWINQAMASPATGNKTMLFGDLSKYFVRKVGSPVIGVMRERFWPDLGIAGLIRFDGELGDQAAVRHLIQA